MGLKIYAKKASSRFPGLIEKQFEAFFSYSLSILRFDTSLSCRLASSVLRAGSVPAAMARLPTLINSPTATKFIMSDVPPKLINGNGTPMTGNSPDTMAMLITA